MRGEIIQYANGVGLISGDDGGRYSFTAAELGVGARVWPGAKVDFVVREGAAAEIYPLAASSQVVRRGENLSLWGYFKKCMRLYADGNGRARRKEYWAFILFTWLLFVALFALILVPVAIAGGEGETPDAFVGVVAIVFLVAMAAFIIPSVALLSRRLHDIGMSGWFVLVSFIPYIGGLFALVIALIPSQRGANQYGPSPFEGDIAETFS